MKNKIKFLGIIAVIAIIVLSMTACGETKHRNIESITRFLEKQTGTSAENPASLFVAMNLGNMESSESGWGQLMSALSSWGGYVNLDISECTMSVTVFNPGSNFYNRIVSIVLPDVITEIADTLIRNWTGVPAISFSDKNNLFSVINNVVYSKDLKTLIRVPTRHKGEFIIPDHVTSIGDSAFRNCWDITSVIIPNSVTSIGIAAFKDCWEITSVIIPNSVVNIGHAAFENCKGLINITIPNSVVSIGEAAFLNCDQLSNITIPDSVINIGDGAFWDCYGLTRVTILGNIPISNFSPIAFGTSFNGVAFNLRDEYFLPNGGPGTYIAFFWDDFYSRGMIAGYRKQ